MMHIGIDPGLSGAIAFLPAGREAYVVDMPVSKISDKGFVKNAVDVDKLAQLLRVSTTGFDIVEAHAWVERVSAFPGQGVASMFSLGMSYWGAVGALAGVGIDHTLIEAKDWKNRYHLAKDKGLSLALARRLYPAVDLGLKKNHGRAEALLIARHGQLLTEGK
jgi:hypothetical protein